LQAEEQYNNNNNNSNDNVPLYKILVPGKRRMQQQQQQDEEEGRNNNTSTTTTVETQTLWSRIESPLSMACKEKGPHRVIPMASLKVLVDAASKQRIPWIAPCTGGETWWSTFRWPLNADHPVSSMASPLFALWTNYSTNSMNTPTTSTTKKTMTNSIEQAEEEETRITNAIATKLKRWNDEKKEPKDNEDDDDLNHVVPKSRYRPWDQSFFLLEQAKHGKTLPLLLQLCALLHPVPSFTMEVLHILPEQASVPDDEGRFALHHVMLAEEADLKRRPGNNNNDKNNNVPLHSASRQDMVRALLKVHPDAASVPFSVTASSINVAFMFPLQMAIHLEWHKQDYSILLDLVHAAPFVLQHHRSNNNTTLFLPWIMARHDLTACFVLLRAAPEVLKEQVHQEETFAQDS